MHKQSYGIDAKEGTGVMYDEGASDLEYDYSDDENGLRLGIYLYLCVIVVFVYH